MTIDELFVLTLYDIEDRLQPGGKEYDVFMVAGLLRKIFLDETPLIHAVNRPRRIDLRFEITDTEPEPGTLGWFPNDTLHPASRLPQHGVVSCNFKQFLRRVVLVADGEKITVHDLIDFLSQNFGAVHATRAVTQKEKPLRDAVWGTRLFGPQGGFPGPVAALRPVARLTLDGLKPLREPPERETTLGGVRPRSQLGLGRHEDPQHRDLERP